MAARLYPTFAQGLSNGSIDWTSLTPKALLLSADFAYDPAKAYRDELTEGFIIETSTPVTPTLIDGVYGADGPFSWLQYSDNRQVGQIVLFDDTGDDAYSQLIAHWTAEDITGVPFTPAGRNYYLYPVTPPGGFFSIGGSAIDGMIGSYSLAAEYALGEVLGGETVSLPTLIVTTALDVRDRVCIPASEVESCCTPTFRGSACA